MLNAACFFEQVSIVKYILDKDEDNICLNAKIDTSDFTNYHNSIGNALHKVCELSSECEDIKKIIIIAKMLLEKNPKLVNVKDDLGNTPLHIAFECRDLDMIKLLLDYATEEDLNIENGNGQTIRQLAQRLKESEKDELEETTWLLPIPLGTEPSIYVLN